MKRYVASLFIILILWIIYSSLMNNPYLDIKPYDVLLSLISIMNSNTIHILLNTFMNCFISVLLAFVLALVIVLGSNNSKFINQVISSIVNIITAIPTISFILFLLVLVKREHVSQIMVFLISFPLCFNQMNQLCCKQNLDYELLLLAYPLPFTKKILKFDLPLLKEYFAQFFIHAFSYGLKVEIMSEVIAYDNKGVGFAMNNARLNLDMDLLVAWTILVILLMVTMDIICISIDREYKKHHE